MADILWNKIFIEDFRLSRKNIINNTFIAIKIIHNNLL
jgi:hypothetical protein